MNTMLPTGARGCAARVRTRHTKGIRKGVLVVVDRPETCDLPGCPAPVHGNRWAYREGCRGTAAKEDWRLYTNVRRQGRYEPRTIDGTGTARRLQALAAIGWGSTDVAELLGFSGVSRRHVQRLRHAMRVNVQTAAAVRDLYDRLSMTPGASPIARRRALEAGYVPPLAWDEHAIDDPAAKPAKAESSARGDDWVKVDRACAGLVQDLTTSEREQAVRLLHRLRQTDGEIAEKLRITARTALRIRQRLALPPVMPSGRETQGSTA